MRKSSLSCWATIAFLTLSSPSLFAQNDRPIGLNNPNVKPLNQIAAHTVPALNRPAIFAEDLLNDGPGVAPRYAIPNAVDLTPLTSGTWEVASPTHSLWRLRIQCPGAVHVNLGFQRFKMPAGAQLMVYAADYSYLVRPFTGRDHNPDGQLWTPVVFDDEIVVELYVPTALRAKADVRLTQIGSGYRFFGFGASALLAEGSGSCNVDVACPQGSPWAGEISAVAAISTGGSIFCSGSMINNTAGDSRNLFLTADHCSVTTQNASSLVCYWNYEEASCAASGTASLSQFTTGATFRADYAPSDFTLVELNSAPNPAWNVGYAGWSRSSANATSAVGIHHPSGDAKKISFENQSTTTTSYSSSSSPGNGTHVRVIDWDTGTTEGGSSGSPLFDQNQRIIGQLHGGGAACGNNLSDWYGRLSVSWTGGGTNSSRLSNWLDPLGTSAITVDTIGGGGGGPVAPANDECANAIVVSDGVNGSYSSVGATTSSPAWGCATGGGDVWFAYLAPCTGTATFDTCSATRNFDTAIEAFTGSCGSLTQVGCNDDSCQLGSSLTINTTIGATYFVRVGGYQAATGVFDLTVGCSGDFGPSNDECSGALTVADGVNGPFSSSTATTSSPTWSCASGGTDVWFRYVATCTGTATFDTCTGTRSFDTAIEVFDGTCGSPNLMNCNDDSCSTGSSTTISTTLGATYFVRVGGYQSASGSFDLVIDCTGPSGPANDECVGAVAIADGVNGAFTNATATTSAPAWACDSGGNDLWFSYSASCTGNASVSLCSGVTNFDTVLEVFGGSCGSLGLLACDNDQCGVNGGSEVTFAATSGTTYFVRVGGFQGATGTFDITVNCTPAGGSIASVTSYGVGCNDRARSFWDSPEQGAFDLGLRTLGLLPNAQGGYDVTTGPVAWTAPSGGDLLLGDDQVAIRTLPFTLSFPGGSTNQISICSNGYIWLDGVTTTADFSTTTAEFSAQAPRLCPVWTDFDPSSGGSVHYVETGGNVIVTWSQVPEFNQSNSSSFQCVITPSGAIEFRYLGVNIVASNRDTIVGFSSGNGARLPAATDLSVAGSVSTSGPDATPLEIVATTLPILGTTLTLGIEGIPTGSLGGAVLLGFTPYTPGLDLTIIEMPGCQLLTTGDLTLPFSGIPTASVSLPLSTDPGIVGAHLYAQAASISPGQNPRGILMSNGVDLVFDLQ